MKEVARARTFGFMQDVEAMRVGRASRSAAACRTPSSSTSIASSTREGLRYDNEFVKHKVLDAIGDLYLLGHPLIGQYTAFKSGHALNNALARALLARPDAFELVTFAEPERRAVGVQGLAAHARVTRRRSRPRRLPARIPVAAGETRSDSTQ